MSFKLDKKKRKQILTTEGYITIERLIYRPKDEKTKEIIKSIYNSKRYIPLDIYLGINNLPFRITPDMALRIAMAGALSSSYSAAHDFFQNAYDLSIGEDRIRKVTDFLGNIIFQEDKDIMEMLYLQYNAKKVRADRNNCIAPNPKEKERFVLYLLMDGGTYNSRGEKDKNGSTYREHKLGLAFKSTDLKISQKINNEGEIKYELRLGDKREYICYAGEVGEFRKYLVALAMKNNLYEAEDVVILGDGADWIQNTKEQLFPYAIQILDIFHLMENVSAFARYLIDEEIQRKEWVSEVRNLLEKGAWQTVLSMPEIYVYKTQKTPKGVPNLYRYIYNHRNLINYPEYEASGYFIGSGAIESGIKNIGHQRLKQSGMRWWQEKAQTILSLRAKIKSDLWQKEVVPLVYKMYKK